MAITPVSHQGYITQLFQPLAIGKNQGADQATATDQLDGIINSVKQHSFKVPEWMQKSLGLPGTVSDLKAVASAINEQQGLNPDKFIATVKKNLEDFKAGLNEWIERGDQGMIDNAQQLIHDAENLLSDPEKFINKESVGAFIIKNGEIAGYVRNSGASGLGDNLGSSFLLSGVMDAYKIDPPNNLDQGIALIEKMFGKSVSFVKV